MKVQISFEIDLEKLYQENKNEYILRDMSFEDFTTELRLLFGNNFERMSRDVYIEYTNDFTQMFNY